MLREFVNSQHFTSTSEIMESMKELFSDVLQQVMEAELEEKLGYEKSERLSKNDENSCRENYRNGYSKKTVKTQFQEIEMENMNLKSSANTVGMRMEWRRKFLDYIPVV